jgi:hypothetical protein
VLFSVYATYTLLESMGGDFLLPSAEDAVQLLRSVFSGLTSQQLVKKLQNKKLTFLKKPVTVCAKCVAVVQRKEHHLINDVLHDICRDAAAELTAMLKVEEMRAKTGTHALIYFHTVLCVLLFCMCDINNNT